MAFDKIPTVAVSATPQNRPLLALASDNKQKAEDDEAVKIDSYFASFGSPLAGYGKKFVAEAEKNDIPWNLLASIAMQESTAGLHGCDNNNDFGWGSCAIGFKSVDDAIETISKNLGGNNPNTAHFYADKTVEQMLTAYNPPKFAKLYVKKVKAIMKAIDDYPLPDEVTVPTANS